MYMYVIDPVEVQPSSRARGERCHFLDVRIRAVIPFRYYLYRRRAPVCTVDYNNIRATTCIREGLTVTVVHIYNTKHNTLVQNLIQVQTATTIPRLAVSLVKYSRRAY